MISVKEVNLSPLYSTVDHSLANDNAAFGGDASVVRDFCPYPLPLFYRLSSVLHQVISRLSHAFLLHNNSTFYFDDLLYKLFSLWRAVDHKLTTFGFLVHVNIQLSCGGM